jgi:hypothetical protein
LNNALHSQQLQGREDVLQTNINEVNKYVVDGSGIVSKTPLKLFQECLVHHFDIHFHPNNIAWQSHESNY